MKFFISVHRVKGDPEAFNIFLFYFIMFVVKFTIIKTGSQI